MIHRAIKTIIDRKANKCGWKVVYVVMETCNCELLKRRRKVVKLTFTVWEIESGKRGREVVQWMAVTFFSNS